MMRRAGQRGGRGAMAGEPADDRPGSVQLGDLGGEGVRRRPDDDLDDPAGAHDPEGAGGAQGLLVDQSHGGG